VIYDCLQLENGRGVQEVISVRDCKFNGLLLIDFVRINQSTIIISELEFGPHSLPKVFRRHLSKYDVIFQQNCD